MIRQGINKILSYFGYCIIKEINNPSHPSYGLGLGYNRADIADSYIKVIKESTMLPYLNLLTLFEQVIYCEENNIEGDYVECGVWKGGAIGLMALGNLNFGKNRRNIHLFDIFDEIGSPNGKVDGEKAIKEVQNRVGKNAKISGENESLRGFYKRDGGPGKIDENKHLLEDKIGYPPNKIYYHKGWFQETVPKSINTIKKIAILRLDADWYAPTIICLDNLYDKVVEGGIIIVDDYGCYEGCKKAVDEFIKKRSIRVLLNYSNTECRYWIKNQPFH